MSRSPHPLQPFFAAILALTALAGCVDTGETEGETLGDATQAVDLDAFVNPLIEDHDHTDEALHGLAWNMQRTGGALLDEGLRGHAAPHALDIKGGKLFVSAYAATMDDVAGVYIFDVAADPSDPPLLGAWTIPGPAGGDRNMEATADGRFVVVSYEEQDCGGNINPYKPGTYLIDATDPTEPVEVDYKPFPTEGVRHSITIHSLDDGDYVYPGPGADQLWKIDRDSRTLVEVGTFTSGHDSAVFEDPLGNRTLLLSADVSKMQIYDLADPAKPELIGGWAPEHLGSYYIHTAVADHIGGRNIAIVNSEDFMTDPSTFWVLDITDPTDVKELAQWFSPDGVPSGDLLFSLHNPRIEAGILTFSYYHGGVWQFDLNDPARWEDPRPRGHYLPHDPLGPYAKPDGTPVMSRVCGTLLNSPDGSLDVPTDTVPFTFDVEVQDGWVYAADLNTGMHVLRFDPGNGTTVR